MKSYPDCESTLTRAEREALFVIPPPDNDPLPRRTRLAVVWDGPRWAELDPATGDLIAAGEQEARAA